MGVMAENGVVVRAMIAERTVLAIDASGRESTIALGVGLPYEIGPGEWACPVRLDGLQNKLPDLRGIDSWQALQLAHQLLSYFLRDFIADGGRLFWPDGCEPLAIDEIFSRY